MKANSAASSPTPVSFPRSETPSTAPMPSSRLRRFSGFCGRETRHLRLAERANQDFNFRSVRQINILEEIKNAAAESGADSARLGPRTWRFQSWSRGRACRATRGFIECFIGKGVGFAVLFAVDVIDAEGIERLCHFSCALEKRLKLRALHFV